MHPKRRDAFVAIAEKGSFALRPAEIASRRFLVAKKGYEPDEVHAFLKQVSEQLSRLQGEIEWQRARVEHLERRTVRAQEAAYARISRDFVDVVHKADEAASKVRTDAEQEARAAMNAARDKAAAIAAISGREAEKFLTQARAEAERMVAEAADSVKRLVWEARQAPPSVVQAMPQPVEAEPMPVVDAPPEPVVEPRTALWEAPAVSVWEASPAIAPALIPPPAPAVVPILPPSDSEADQGSDAAVVDEAPVPQLPGTEEPEFEVPELVDLAELWEAVPSTRERSVGLGRTSKPPAVHPTAPENLDVSIDVSFSDLFEDTAE
jgi:DivIVA domain-containing protein